jgi:hypothetical protein
MTVIPLLQRRDRSLMACRRPWAHRFDARPAAPVTTSANVANVRHSEQLTLNQRYMTLCDITLLSITLTFLPALPYTDDPPDTVLRNLLGIYT